jgi:chaperonin GroES
MFRKVCFCCTTNSLRDGTKPDWPTAELTEGVTRSWQAEESEYSFTSRRPVAGAVCKDWEECWSTLVPRTATHIEKEMTAMKVRPLHDRILLKRIEEKESIKGGIIIPDTAKEKPQEGLVVAVGNGKILENGTKISLEVKDGDRVLFGKYSGTEIKVDGEEYLIVREDDVLGILAESAKSKASK